MPTRPYPEARNLNLAGQVPGWCVARFVEPDGLVFSVDGESVAFAVGFAPGLPLLVKVFDFVPEGARVGFGDEKGTLLGAVQAGGGPGAVGDGEVFPRRSILAGGDTGQGDGQQYALPS